MKCAGQCFLLIGGATRGRLIATAEIICIPCEHARESIVREVMPRHYREMGEKR